MRALLPPLEYATYAAAWERVAQAGRRDLNLDVWAGGWRYLSLSTVCLDTAEVAQLQRCTRAFSDLLDRAVDGILADPDWWPALAWPRPAIELARQEPSHPGGRASLFGRFDCLLDPTGTWRIIEFNADTPSGAREASGLEPALARLQPGLRPLSPGLPRRLISALLGRIAAHPRPVRLVGVVAPHSWLEDIAQATWLARQLEAAGQPALVGDVTDLEVLRARVTLRGRPIDALYRFYPVEALYRHWIFAELSDAAIAGRLLLLNGLRGFLAQSKACLAWLWAHHQALGADASASLERHLPPTYLMREPAAAELARAQPVVVKHVNGREGDSVVFGDRLDGAGWEARLLEGGYVVQRAVETTPLADIAVDDWRARVSRVEPRYACVGAFAIDGRFGGCYTRLDGPITSSRASYVATLAEPRPDAAGRRR